MKKFFITLLVFTFAASLFAQQVARERVIVEIGTATWCGPCQGAAMGAEDLVANGHDVAIIEYHNTDPFANAASNYRNNYNSVSGIPNAHFDGVLVYVGGSSSTSMYNILY
jgi:thiol-disulfide isomerase/thioredoxin